MKDPSVPLLIDFRTFQVFHLGFFLLFEMKISGWLGRALDNTRCQSRVGDKAVNNFAVRTSGWHAVAARNGRAHSSSHVPSESDASLSCIKSATPLRLHTTQAPAARHHCRRRRETSRAVAPRCASSLLWLAKLPLPVSGTWYQNARHAGRQPASCGAVHRATACSGEATGRPILDNAAASLPVPAARRRHALQFLSLIAPSPGSMYVQNQPRYYLLVRSHVLRSQPRETCNASVSLAYECSTYKSTVNPYIFC
jgi:hypothetical protein